MKRFIIILNSIVLIILSSCDSFEKRFYDDINQGQVNAIEKGTDTFDLSLITDFEWDSVILIKGNSSVPLYKEEIEVVINNTNSNFHWEDRRFKGVCDLKLKYKTTDLPTYRDRFYFLTPNKEMIEKEIKGGGYSKPAFSINYCMLDSVTERVWLSKKECNFILKSNVTEAGEGTVFLYPDCK